jgi:hypothetical protein
MLTKRPTGRKMKRPGVVKKAASDTDIQTTLESETLPDLPSLLLEKWEITQLRHVLKLGMGKPSKEDYARFVEWANETRLRMLALEGALSGLVVARFEGDALAFEDYTPEVLDVAEVT